MSRHRFHGDPSRFAALAAFVDDRYGKDVHHIADVAGGQGMLCRLLRKKYNYDCEVVDTRGWTLKGVPARAEEFSPSMADHYDLVIGLHPDEATRAVAGAALIRPAIVVPCCNFWSAERLGAQELLAAIEAYYSQHQVSFERVQLPFKGPKNTAIVSAPTARSGGGHRPSSSAHTEEFGKVAVQ